MTNSADLDQLLLQKSTDLDLHCLLRQGMSCSAREGLICMYAANILQACSDTALHTGGYCRIKMLCMLGKVFSRLHFEIFFLFSPENRL